MQGNIGQLMPQNLPGTIASSRTLSAKAVAYRLAMKPDSSIVLQGAYENSNGSNWFLEWRDIPLVYLDENGDVKPS